MTDPATTDGAELEFTKARLDEVSMTLQGRGIWHDAARRSTRPPLWFDDALGPVSAVAAIAHPVAALLFPERPADQLAPCLHHDGGLGHLADATPASRSVRARRVR